MPLYEYTCKQCSRRFSWLVGVVADPTPPTCPHCRAAHAEKRAVSRFAHARTDEQALSDLADIDPAAFDNPSDPRAMQRWAKEMGALAGESGGGLGDEFDEYIDAAHDAHDASQEDR